MRKKYIIILLVILAIILLSMLIFAIYESHTLELNSEVGNSAGENHNTENSFIGTVIAKDTENDTNSIDIRLDDETVLDDSIISILNTDNNFELGDRFKINYTNENGNVQISSIEKYKDSENEKYKDIRTLLNDEKIKEFKNNIRVFVDNEEKPFFILPFRIANTEYTPMGESKFIDVYNHIFDGLLVRADKDSTIKVDLKMMEDVKIIELYNLDNSFKTKINYDLNENVLKFTSLDKGIYCLKLEGKNGDIIEVLFL